jgi:dephospho-CoA kinase
LLKVGLTGGIASGKSAVGEMFVALGARLIQADSIAHQLMQPGQPVYGEIVRHFGPGILNPDGTINRPKLADAAFDSGPVAEKKSSPVIALNRIVHPAVIRRQEEWMAQIGRLDPGAVAIVEAALIIEAGAASRFDRLIVVTCRHQQRLKRFAARHNLSLEAARQEVTRRMAAQLSDEEKIKAADYVIDNAGSLEGTREQVREVWQQLEAQNPG